MKISQIGIDLIKKFEGCKLTAYKDSVGVWTIGWGTTNADKSITNTTIKQGLIISQSTADSWLEKSVNNKYVPKVMKYDSIYKWNQNQLDALTSFAYNIGSIDGLTNNGKRSISEISSKILSYNKAGGKVLAGLTTRRKAERTLFDTKVEKTYTEGWKQDSTGWWYQYSDGSYPKSCWKKINGKDYYFKADGYMASDEYIKASNYDTTKKLYYVNKSGDWNNKSYRWMSNSVGWWIVEIGGSWYAQNEWAKIDGEWYYFDDKGYMLRNKLKTINGVTYEFDNDGVATKR